MLNLILWRSYDSSRARLVHTCGERICVCVFILVVSAFVGCFHGPLLSWQIVSFCPLHGPLCPDRMLCWS
jgi:hypothetical protein